MSKNILIISLSVIIAILIGIIMITNYPIFSNEWLVGLGLIAISISAVGVVIYRKIKN